MSADLYFTGILLSFFFRQLISELAERNSTIFGHMVGSKCNLKMRVRNLGYRIHLQIGGPKITFLGRLNSQLSGNFNGNFFGTKQDIDNRLSALTTTGVSYIVPICHELWSYFVPFQSIAHPLIGINVASVSYTHLTLPTIYSV